MGNEKHIHYQKESVKIASSELPHYRFSPYEIEIVNFNFSQLALTITSGSTVTWTNKDSARHTVTSDSGSELNSELFGKDETYSHTFNELGTFDYHCAPHPYMKAKIVVE